MQRRIIVHLQYKDFEKIINIGIRLSTEKDRNRLLRAILDNGMEITIDNTV